MKDLFIFFCVYVIAPALFVSGMCVGFSIQKKDDAEQSISPKPSAEWQVAVLRAKIDQEEKETGR